MRARLSAARADPGRQPAVLVLAGMETARDTSTHGPTRDLRPIAGVAIGTFLVVVGDALYGLSYYERQPTEGSLFIVSAVLGLVAGALYAWGGRELGRWMASPSSQRAVSLALICFGATLAVVHAFAGGLMIAFDAALRHPDSAELASVVTQMDTLYGVLAIPMFVALIVAYAWHGVETWRGRAGVPRWTLCVNPLVLVAIQQPFASALWFPLRSAAWAGLIQLLVLLVVLRRRSAAEA